MGAVEEGEDGGGEGGGSTLRSLKPLILVVDDFRMMLDLVSKIIKQMGYAVRTASNGQEAINVYREEAKRIKLILMDCEMPIKDGLTATKEIRALEDEAGGALKVPIIAMTANAMREDRRE